MSEQGVEYIVIVHEAEEREYWTEVPALPGAGSQGETVDEAIANTKESIEAVIEVMREKGEEVPKPRELVVKITVAA